MSKKLFRPEQHVHEYVTNIELCKDERRFQGFYYAIMDVCRETYIQNKDGNERTIISQTSRKLELTLSNHGLNKSIGKISRHITMLGIDAINFSTVKVKSYQESKEKEKKEQ